MTKAYITKEARWETDTEETARELADEAEASEKNEQYWRPVAYEQRKAREKWIAEAEAEANALDSSFPPPFPAIAYAGRWERAPTSRSLEAWESGEPADWDPLDTPAALGQD